MEQTSIQLDEDEERFRKLQMSDQANFEDKLDTLQVGVFASMLARREGGGTPPSVSLDECRGWGVGVAVFSWVCNNNNK